MILKGIPEVEELNGMVRFENHDELRYSLRSVFENLPWINHIYLITNKQRPTWLKEHPKITVVDHTEIIPSELLPTFSSVVIENYLTKIPGLNEHFLYFNDDMFINRHLSPREFFDGDKPIVWMADEYFGRFPENISVEDNIRMNADEWERTLLRAWDLFQRKNNIKIPFLTPNHSVDAYCKSMIDSTLNKYPEIQLANRPPFRTGNEISRVFFSYEMIFNHDCQYVLRWKSNRLNRVLSRVGLRVPTVIVSNSLEYMIETVRKRHPKPFCLTSLRHEESEAAKIFMQKKFPNAAPWEG